LAIITFDQFADLVDQAIKRIPARFYRDLNGGFNVQPGKKRDGRWYIMGEYVCDSYLGCLIILYYGSFVALLKGEPEPVWAQEIMETVIHELQHHREAMAGRDDLARREIEELEKILKS